MKNIIVATGLCMATVAGAQDQQAPADLTQALNAFGALMNGGTNALPVVDFRELKALLPADLGGLKRTEASGEKQSNFGVNLSMAEGRYSDGDEKYGNVKITDFGGMSAAMLGLQFGWANMEIDKETDTGFERTTTIGEHKALEKYDAESKSGSIEIVVNKRFMIEADATGLTAEAFKAAMAKIDLAKLASLQPKPAK